MLDDVADLGSENLSALSICHILVVCTGSLFGLVLNLVLMIHAFDVGISQRDLTTEDLLVVLGHGGGESRGEKEGRKADKLFLDTHL